MSEIWLIVLAVVGLALAWKVLTPTRLNSALEQARNTGEVAGIVAAIESAPEKKHPNMWDQSISRLWEEYHREAALDLMVAAARRSEAPVVQFWLKKAMEVEPEMAEQRFSDEFLEKYFRPAVAAKCGRVGCCG